MKQACILEVAGQFTRRFAANAIRLQLHALAYNLGNFLRALATPEPIQDWSLSSLAEKLIKISTKVVSRGHYVAFGMAPEATGLSCCGKPAAVVLA